jgi:hypothetical protein
MNMRRHRIVALSRRALADLMRRAQTLLRALEIEIVFGREER